MRPCLLLLVTLWPLVVQNERDAAKKDTETEIYFTETIVATPYRLDHFVIPEDQELSTSSRFTSFSRQGISALPQKDGANQKGSVEMRNLQKIKQTQHRVLWCLWPALGTVLGQALPTPFDLCHGWLTAQAEWPVGLGHDRLGAEAKAH